MFKKHKGKLVAVASNARTKAVALGTGAMVLAGSAMASGGGSEFDSGSIVTKINENAGVATVILGAMILAYWGLRSMGLLKGRG